MPAPLESFNPATGARLGSVPTSTAADVTAVVDAVRRVQPFWAQLTLRARGRYLERAAQAIIDEADDIRDLIVAEQGKPRMEAFSMEVLPSIDSLEWIVRDGCKLLEPEPVPVRQLLLRSKQAVLAYEPLGVIGVIASWNYPWSIPFSEAAMALMAGNGVVIKPSSLTPLVGERIQRVFERAGIPDGLVRVVHGPDAAPALAESAVGKVFFSGSVPTGRRVAEACARGLKGCVLELGGKDPMIVLEDANLEHAVAGALWGGFANAGQSRSAVERVYVRREVAEPFLQRLIAGARALRVGDPRGWEIEVGPLISAAARDRVVALVDEAVRAGAVLHCGGPVAGPPGLDAGAFYAPAVLTDVTPAMGIMREEIHGPVLCVMTVDSEEQAVRQANDSEYGLGASVWTADRGRGERVAAELQAGMVWINEHLFSHGACQLPWGGTKVSGVGRTHSKFGLYECVNVKLQVWEPSTTRSSWWFPYDETLGRALQHATRVLYGRPSIRAGALREGAGPLLKVGARLARDALRRS